MVFCFVIVATDDIGIKHIEEFLAEAAFMKHYNHANILKPLGVVWSDGDRPQVILPYMAKGDLCSFVRKSEMVSMANILHEVYCISIQIASVINLNDTQNEIPKNIFSELTFLILFQLQSGCFVKVYLCHLSSLLTLRCGKL